jgi:hypothetical protein
MRLLGTCCICAILMTALELVGWAKGSEKGFEWRGRIDPGKALLLRNLNGPVSVEAASGGEVEVTATVAFEKSNPRDIRFEQRSDERGVHICAAWPGQQSCLDGQNDGKVTNNDLSVTFHVKLPRGTTIDAATVNGDMTVRGLAAAARLATVNGAVEIEGAATDLRAETVNGGVDARLTSLAGVGDLKLATVNGDINVQIPANSDAEVAAKTVAGRISILGSSYRERVRTTLGRGGRKLSAQTVNGSIEVR